MKKRIGEIFDEFFGMYKNTTGRSYLSYVVTSRDRKGGKTNPHAIPGNAMDLTLRSRGDYSPIIEYNELFIFMLNFWEYRAGIDNTTGNIHIHIDLGETKTTGMPFFFKEDNGKFQHVVKSAKDL